jgi:hypothetical protein
MRGHKWFANITEQSVYTLAYDMITLKRVRAGQKLCEQATKSGLNIEYRVKQQRSVEKFLSWMKGHGTAAEAIKRFQEAAHPAVADLEAEHDEVAAYLRRVRDELNRREAAYGKKGTVQEKDKEERKIDIDDDAEGLRQKTELGMFRGYPRNPKTVGELARERGKIEENLMMGRDLAEEKEKLKENQAETEKELAAIAKMQPHYRKEVLRSMDCHALNRDLLTGVLQRIEALLGAYRRSRDAAADVEQRLPEDPAGIYILLDGVFTVKNEYNPDDGGTNRAAVDLYRRREAGSPDAGVNKGAGRGRGDGLASRPDTMDVVGAEKFLQVQGYTYYGCLYASSQQKMPETKKQPPTQRQPSLVKGGKDLAATLGSTFTSMPDEQGSPTSQGRAATVSGFIDAKLLHLLPFYDLYVLKDDLQDRYNQQCKYLKQNCKLWYSDILGRLK